MGEIFLNILRVLAGVAFVVFCLYLRWKSLDGRVKDLGNGGVQRLFDDKENYTH